MAYYSFLIVLTPIFFVLFKVWTSRIRRRQHEVEASRRGCLPPPSLRSNNLLGTQILKESIKATKEDRGPQYVISAMDRLGPAVHTCRVPVLDYELLVTRDPENVKALFVNLAADFDIGPNRSKSWWPLLGQGIFTARGETWKHSRALVRPQFARAQVENLQLEEKHVQALLRRLSTGDDGWTAKLDLQPLFFSFTLDTATEFLFGTSANSLDPIAGTRSDQSGVCSGVDFGKHLDAAKIWIDKRGALAKFYWLLSSKEFKVHCAAIHAYVDAIVSDVLTKQQSEKYDAGKDYNKKFVLLESLAQSTPSALELRNETLHILTAGRDPTGALLSWIFYFLARNPIIYTKLRGIILSHFGGRDSEIRLHDLKSCTYLQHVITETLRVAAIIPMNERVATHDTMLPRGGGPDGMAPVFVSEGTQVLIPKYAMQHRADIWGEDVEEFRPERWEGRKAGFEFVPFGGGVRKCLGRECYLVSTEYMTFL